MTMIFRYPLQLAPVQFVTMPKDARILSTAFWKEAVCIWAEVNPDVAQPSEDRKIHIVGTGHEGEWPIHFIGTVLMPDQGLVFHVFEGA